MARRRKQSKRREKRTTKGKSPATPPTEDPAEFSYLVDEGVLTLGKEHETYYLFVTRLIADAKNLSDEFSTFPYLLNTKGSPGQSLCRLTHEISYFKQEMDKIERELSTLDLGPKEFAILDVVLRIARDRFDDISKPNELRECVEGLASKSIFHPIQKRRNRATLVRAREGLIEARELSSSFRLGTVRQHREQGKLGNVKANVREVMLPAGQSKLEKITEVHKEWSRLIHRISTPWSSLSNSNLRAAQPPQVNLKAGVAEVPERRGSKNKAKEGVVACGVVGALMTHPNIITRSS